MKKITKTTKLRKGDKFYHAVEVDGVIYWFDIYNVDIATNTKNDSNIPVVNLDNCKINPNQYTLADIKKAVRLGMQAVDAHHEIGLFLVQTEEEVLEQLNSILVIEVDDNFNVINYG